MTGIRRRETRGRIAVDAAKQNRGRNAAGDYRRMLISPEFRR